MAITSQTLKSKARPAHQPICYTVETFYHMERFGKENFTHSKFRNTMLNIQFHLFVITNIDEELPAGDKAMEIFFSPKSFH